MHGQHAATAAGGCAPHDNRTGTSDTVLSVEGLTLGYGSRRILADLHFALPARGITVLMGPGGAGKSTLLHWLAGLPASGRRFHEGQARYRGVPISAAPMRPALVQQKAQLLMGRLGEMLAAGLRPRMQATPAQLRQATIERLHALQLEALADSLDSIVADLSTADVRIAAILRSAFADHPLLLIDEPTPGLSEAEAERVLMVIERVATNCACLVTTHNQTHARRLASRAMLLAGGHILVDAPADDFFANTVGHPVLAQFLRTGSCSVAGLDARPEQLEDAAAGSGPSIDPDAADERTQARPHSINASHIEAVEPSTRTTSVETGSAPAAPARTPVAGDAALRREDEPASLIGCARFPPNLGAPPSSLGPTGFRWLVRGRIAGCAMPGVVSPVDHDLALLKRMGITLLINLTEHDFPQDALERHGLKGFAVRIEDRRAPPLIWAKLLLAKMDRFLREGEVMAVHCLAGLGRTGTILCAWLIREGLTAAEALRRLRAIDPGFVQSEEQEQLLVELENNLLIRAQ